jgi:cysteinyl-tRNA synthetase
VTLRLLDTLTGGTTTSRPFARRTSACTRAGPTVYGPAHIGNFRSFLVADLLVRYLRYRGYDVSG